MSKRLFEFSVEISQNDCLTIQAASESEARAKALAQLEKTWGESETDYRVRLELLDEETVGEELSEYKDVPKHD